MLSNFARLAFVPVRFGSGVYSGQGTTGLLFAIKIHDPSGGTAHCTGGGCGLQDVAPRENTLTDSGLLSLFGPAWGRALYSLCFNAGLAERCSQRLAFLSTSPGIATAKRNVQLGGQGFLHGF